MGKSGPKSRYTDAHRAWFREQAAKGLPHHEIAASFTALTGIKLATGTLHKMLANEPKLPPRKKPGHLARYELALEADEMDGFREVARRLGYINRIGRRAGEGSIPDLAAAIGRGDVLLKALTDVELNVTDSLRASPAA